MSVAIGGMHRSGTSMVASLLRSCGLYLGRDDELMAASRDNVDGHWEHLGFVAVNDDVLAACGGAWDHPPAERDGWEAEPRLEPLAARGRELVAGLAGEGDWGWKDPRTSLTIPFWRWIVPELRVVVCLRNPLEVALSLHRRQFFSYERSLSLWQTYNERILAATAPEGRIVTHYGAYFPDPAPELMRVAEFCGLSPSRPAIQAAVERARGELRHADLPEETLAEASVSSEVIELYERLCEEAGRSARRRSRAHDAPPLNHAVLDAELVRGRLEAAERALAARRRDNETLQTELKRLNVELAARHEVDRSIASLCELVAGQEGALGALREEVASLRRRVMDAFDELHDRMELVLETGPTEARQYRELVRRLPEVVSAAVPAGAAVAIVTKGDEDLLRLPERRAWHYPQTEKGAWTGFHPADGIAAIAHLEALRIEGADFLLIPEPSRWWLEHYTGLRRHLEQRYRLRDASGAGALYDLGGRPASDEAPLSAQLAMLAERCTVKLGCEPAVLAWGAEREVAGALPELTIFSPPVERDRLPYLDASIDVVVVGDASPERVAEARRVARAAAVVVDEDVEPPRLEVVWEEPNEGCPPTVSVVVAAPASLGHLLEALPESLGGELVAVVGDEGGDMTAPGESTERWRSRRVSGGPLAGLAEAWNRGANAADGALLVFVAPDAVPIGSWLWPLVRVFEERPDVGAVTARLLGRDGRLLEAGRERHPDGTWTAIGAAAVEPSAAAFSYLRAVDGCAPALFAVWRDVFVSRGGLDSTVPAEDAVAAFCARLAQDDLRVYYQPDSWSLWRLRPGAAAEEDRTSAPVPLAHSTRTRPARSLESA